MDHEFVTRTYEVEHRLKLVATIAGSAAHLFRPDWRAPGGLKLGDLTREILVRRGHSCVADPRHPAPRHSEDNPIMHRH